MRHPLLLSTLLILIDQASKQWVLGLRGSLDPGLISQPLPFFNLVLVWNRGISFGMFSQHPEWMPWILLTLTAALTAALTVWLFRATRPVIRWGLTCIIGGAVGNIVDRAIYGAVVDFLDLHLAGYHWPAFNVADSAIFVGVALLLLDSVLEGREKKS